MGSRLRSARLRRSLVAGIVLALVAVSAPARAAVPPVPYTGSVTLDNVNNGGGGGVLYRGGRYYMITVGHIANALYTQHSVVQPGTYPLGGTAYNANETFGGKANSEDIALIELGTTRPNPRLRVCESAGCPTPPGYTVPQVAVIDSVPTSADLPYGRVICHSGRSAATLAAGGYRCGFANNALPRWTDASCTAYCGISTINGAPIIDGGDSGGPVWQPLPNGHIRLLGHLAKSLGRTPARHGLFIPIWHTVDHVWTAPQSCNYCPLGRGGRVVTGS